MSIAALGLLGFGDAVTKPISFVTPHIVRNVAEMSPQGIVDSLVALVNISSQSASDPLNEMLVLHMMKFFLRKRKHGLQSVFIYVSLLQVLVGEMEKRSETACWRIFAVATLRSLDTFDDCSEIEHACAPETYRRLVQAASTVIELLPTLWGLLGRMRSELVVASHSPLKDLPVGHDGIPSWMSTTPERNVGLPNRSIPRVLSYVIIHSLPQLDAVQLGQLCAMPHPCTWVDPHHISILAHKLLASIATHTLSGADGCGHVSLTALCFLASRVVGHAQCACTPPSLASSDLQGDLCLLCTLNSSSPSPETSRRTVDQQGSRSEKTLCALGSDSVRSAVAAVDRSLASAATLGAIRCLHRIAVPSAMYLSLYMIQTLPRSSLWSLHGLPGQRNTRLGDHERAGLPRWLRVTTAENISVGTTVSDMLMLVFAMLSTTVKSTGYFCPFSADNVYESDVPTKRCALDILSWVLDEWDLRPRSAFVIKRAEISVKVMHVLLSAAQSLVQLLDLHIDRLFARDALAAVKRIVMNVFDATAWEYESMFGNSEGLRRVLELPLCALTSVTSRASYLPSTDLSDDAQLSDEFGHWARVIETIVPALKLNPSSSGDVKTISWLVSATLEHHEQFIMAHLSGGKFGNYDEPVDSPASRLFKRLLVCQQHSMLEIIEQQINFLTVNEALFLAQAFLNTPCCSSWALLQRFAVFFNVHVLSCADESSLPRASWDEHHDGGMSVLWADYSSPMKSSADLGFSSHTHRGNYFLTMDQVEVCSRVLSQWALILAGHGSENAGHIATKPDSVSALLFLRSAVWQSLMEKLQSYPRMALLLKEADEAIQRHGSTIRMCELTMMEHVVSLSVVETNVE
jgi:hypothetical protein